METSFLQTKLYIPPPRPRLIERLNEGLHRTSSVTLISAPAGFGKTTLVSNWLGQINLPATWLSLDKDDSDLTRLLTYFIATLQQILQEIGQTAQKQLHLSAAAVRAMENRTEGWITGLQLAAFSLHKLRPP